MKEIADVLRHRSLDTSAIYAKVDLEQARRSGTALAGERAMTKARTMLSLAADYLSERRALGFDLRIAGNQIVAFARFVDDRGDNGPLTNEIVLNWVQGEAKRASPMSWARRLRRPSPVREVSGAARPRYRVSSDRNLWPLTPPPRAAHLF